MGLIYGEFITENCSDKSDSNCTYEDMKNEKLYTDDSINTIIFDLGGVMVHGKYDDNFSKFLENETDIPDCMCPRIANKWISTHIDDNLTLSQVKEIINNKLDEDEKPFLSTLFKASVDYICPGDYSANIIRMYHDKGYKVYYLSNWSRWQFEELKKCTWFVALLDMFDGGIVSYEVNCEKPDERIYKMIIDKYELTPHKCLFFDDREENITAARLVGFNATQFDIDRAIGLTYEESSNISMSIINESKLESKKRNKLDDSEFGLPDKRKYPLNDKSHVKAAIRMFNHVEDEDEDELADNILSAMAKFKIPMDTIGENNRLKNHIRENAITEGLVWNVPKDEKTVKNLVEKELEKVNTKQSSKEKDQGIIDKATYALTKDQDDAIDEEANIIKKAITSAGLKIINIDSDTMDVNGIAVSHSHSVLIYYKNNIYMLSIGGFGGKVNNTVFVSTKYNSKKCGIPINVVQDVVNRFKYNIKSIHSSRLSVTITSDAKTIDTLYGMIYNKYKNKYGVKKYLTKIKLTTSIIRETCSAVASAVPSIYDANKVFIVNYMNKNTLTKDTAICRDLMSDLYIFDKDPIKTPLSEFMEFADDIELYEFCGICNFDDVIGTSYSGEDFYKKLIKEDKPISNIKYDHRFTRVPSIIDEINAIKECVLSSAPKANRKFTDVLPIVNINESFSSVKYYSGVEGVFAMNENTGLRTNYYSSVSQIPQSVINLLSNI